MGVRECEGVGVTNTAQWVSSDRVNSLLEWYNRIFVEEFGGYRIRFVPRQAVIDRVNVLAQRARAAAGEQAAVTAAVLYLARKIAPANEDLYPELIRRARAIDPLFGRANNVDLDDN